MSLPIGVDELGCAAESLPPRPRDLDVAIVGWRQPALRMDRTCALQRFPRWNRPHTIPAMAVVNSPRFVGREPELARLAAALDEASAGHATSVIVTGAPGLGATRLVDELQSRLGRLSEPWTTLRARGSAPWAGRPLDAVVRPLAAVIETLPANERDVVLGSVVDLTRPDPAGRAAAEPERRQARRLEAIHGVLSRLAAQRPVLLVLDDLHRAD